MKAFLLLPLVVLAACAAPNPYARAVWDYNAQAFQDMSDSSSRRTEALLQHNAAIMGNLQRANQPVYQPQYPTYRIAPDYGGGYIMSPY